MKRAVWVIVVMLWVLILASSLGARVEADDYCYAGVVSSVGVIGSVHHWHMTWYGLYTDQLLSSAIAAIEPYGARVGVPFMLVTVVLSFWYAFSVWYRRTDALLVALAFGAALVFSRPNDEPVYWVSAATSYWLIFAGPAFLFGALARRRTFLAVLVAFVFVALTEAGGILIIAGLTFVLLLWKGHRRAVAFVWLAACLVFLVVFLAPGNAVRRAAVGPIESGSEQVVATILVNFIINLALTVMLSFIPGLFLSGIAAVAPTTAPIRRLPAWLLLVALAASFILSVVATMVLGDGLPPRAIYILTPLWLAQWLALGALIGQRFRYWGLVAPVVGLILIVTAVPHLLQRLDYGRRWDARHAAILAGYRVPGDIGDWDTLTDTSWGVACAEGWYGRPIRFVDGGNVP